VRVGYSFIIFLGGGFQPLNVLNTLKMVPESYRIVLGPPTGGHPGRDGPGPWRPIVVDGLRIDAIEVKGKIKCRWIFCA
jgi:hypothetical protein